MDLCSVRLRKDAKIPDALKKVECSIEPVDEVEAIDGDMGDDKGTGKANKKSLLMEKVPVKFNAEEWKGLCVQEIEEAMKTLWFTRKTRKGT